MALREKGFVVFVAHGLKHLDGGDLIEISRDMTVVLNADFHEI